MEYLVEKLGAFGVTAVVFIIVVGPMIVKIAKEWERGIIFRLGKYDRTRGPGLFLMFPFIENVIKVDIRIIPLDVPPQEIITRDNVTIKVSAVVYFRVINAEDAVVKIVNQNYIVATSLMSQTTLRSILGQSELDELLAQRDKINEKLQKIIDEQTEPWGVKVTAVEIKDVELPQNMQRAMAKQAEAEREKRAKIIHAEGEFQAAGKLADAAHVINREPNALQLRYLQTLTEIAIEKNSTIIFPVPIDTIKPFFEMAKLAAPKEDK